MKIATGDTSQPIKAISAVVEQSQDIRFTVWARADLSKRKVIAAIEAHECPDALTKYISDEDLMIDALYLFDPDMAADIETAYRDHKAILRAGLASIADAGAPAPIPAIAQSAKKETIMFATNQTDGSSRGPWMTWASNGSAMKGIAPKSWVMRGTDERGERFENAIDGFTKPCVFDLESLKLGWEKDGGQGQAPERRYSSHYSVAMPRPDESKKPSGAFTWSNCLQVRVAISKDEAVTWEQGSFGAYQAFTKLAKQIEAQWAEHSQNGALLPVVQMTEVEALKLSNGSTNIPQLDVVKWVPRPAALMDDAPAIATQPVQESTPAPATPAPATVADASAVSDAGGF